MRHTIVHFHMPIRSSAFILCFDCDGLVILLSLTMHAYLRKTAFHIYVYYAIRVIFLCLQSDNVEEYYLSYLSIMFIINICLNIRTA